MISRLEELMGKQSLGTYSTMQSTQCTPLFPTSADRPSEVSPQVNICYTEAAIDTPVVHVPTRRVKI